MYWNGDNVKKDDKLFMAIERTIEMYNQKDIKMKVGYNDKYDIIISCTGFKFCNNMFSDSCKPIMYKNVPDLNIMYESANVKNLFFAGVLMQKYDYKKTSGSFIHGFRYNIRSLFNYLEYKNHNIEWPYTKLRNNVSIITKFLVKRINNTSGLFQNFNGMLSDVLFIKNLECRYYKEIPKHYIRILRDLYKIDKCIIISLEYGKEQFSHNVFGVVATANPKISHLSKFLHPILKYYNNDSLKKEQHLLEDINNSWYHKDVHIRPLIKFLIECQK